MSKNQIIKDSLTSNKKERKWADDYSDIIDANQITVQYYKALKETYSESSYQKYIETSIDKLKKLSFKEKHLKAFSIESEAIKKLDTFVSSQSTSDEHEIEELAQRIISQKNIVLNESWVDNYLFYSKILSVEDETVHVDCIIDEDNGITEVREFKKSLFTHLKNLSEGTHVVIKICEKPGSARIDIIDGKGLKIDSKFDKLIDWDSLKDF